LGNDDVKSEKEEEKEFSLQGLHIRSSFYQREKTNRHEIEKDLGVRMQRGIPKLITKKGEKKVQERSGGKGNRSKTVDISLS